ncbi:MAG: hypothetical protein DDT32_00232 [Syntrophomonadaceae bacterium]|nr:hypothetical protein [Bacillota bacterium]MBT9146500.1 hypothetical protein [Bacillota bacterium]
MAEETYLTREDVLKILKINDERLDALVKEGKLQEKEEGKFDEEDIIIYATEYPPELEEEEMKILPSIEELVAEEEKEEEIELLIPYEETAVEEKEVLPPIEETVPAVDEGLRIEPIESEDEAKAEPGVEPEREELVLFGPRELAPRKSPFFIFLSLLSLVIILASIGILVLPVLDIAIPEFIKPVVDFVSGLF